MSARLAGLAIALAMVTGPLASIGGFASPAADGDPTVCGLPVTVPEDGCSDWISHQDTGLDDAGHPIDVETGADGTVFVLDRYRGAEDPEGWRGYEMKATAYDAASGQTLWTTHVDRPLGDDRPVDIEVGPEGHHVIVAGTSLSSVFELANDAKRHDFLTTALDVDTGDVVWQTNTTGEPSAYFESDDWAVDAAVSDEGVVVVTGETDAPPNNAHNWLTVAIDVETGDTLWTRTLAGDEAEPTVRKRDAPMALGVSSDGSTAVVTGQLDRLNATAISYDVSSGDVAWQTRMDPIDEEEQPSRGLDVVVGEQNAYLRVMDKHEQGDNQWRDLLVALDLSSGEAEWTAIHLAAPAHGAGNYVFAEEPMALHPAGSLLYVTSRGGEDVLAFDTSTGEREWAAPFERGEHSQRDRVGEIGVSKDGSSLFAAGVEGDWTQRGRGLITQAYDASTGETAWTNSYTGATSTIDSEMLGGLAVGGDRVFTHGWTHQAAEPSQFVTIAYDHAGPTSTAPNEGVAR